MRLGRRGFSLIEVMMAIVIMVIMAGLAAYKFTTALPHQRVNQAASALSSDLQYAQLMAVKQRKPVTVTVDTAAKSYTIADRATGTVFKTVKLGSTSEFQLDQLTQTAQVIVFPNGTTSASSTTFTLGSKGYTRWVTISLAGMIRVP
ncbi:MAG TPA: GspH/FimT family pseudopilin [Gemmatimonadales bacterium]